MLKIIIAHLPNKTFLCLIGNPSLDIYSVQQIFLSVLQRMCTRITRIFFINLQLKLYGSIFPLIHPSQVDCVYRLIVWRPRFFCDLSVSVPSVRLLAACWKCENVRQLYFPIFEMSFSFSIFLLVLWLLFWL